MMARGMGRSAPATASRALAKFEGKGFVGFELDGVLGRLTKAQSMDADRVAMLIPVVEMTAQLALAIRERVTKRGLLGDVEETDTAKPYGAKAKYPVSQVYADAAGAKTRLSRWWTDRDSISSQPPQRTVAAFQSSDEFHRKAGTRPGSFLVTGGMWAGLQARGSGQSKAIIDFQGSSPGVGRIVEREVWGWRSPKGGGKPSQVQFTIRYAEPANARNSEKATMIAKMSRVMVIRPRISEIAALTEHVSVIAEEWTAGALGLESDKFVRPQFGGNPELRARLAQVGG